jgi:SAM-dependent methyltransferase
MKESLEYYNQFDEKLIKDYILGNKRIESAICNLSVFIPKTSKRIIDIGCGLGWSTHEFSQYLPNCIFDGVDLSPVLVDKAKTLFNKENLNFKVSDITNQLPEKTYDAIIMIDVYEHIPKLERNKFHKALGNLLKNQSRLILACPSKYHQDYLKQNNPKGLQPIDEDIDCTVIQNLAKDIGGELIYFDYQCIWNNFDYFYAVIERNPIYGSSYNIKSECELILEDKYSRVERVNRKLLRNFNLPKKASSIKLFLKSIKNKLTKR